MSDDSFVTPAGAFDLRRIPEPQKAPLRAWDRADLLLAELAEGDHGGFGAAASNKSVLIVGDGFGALSCALRRFDPVVCMESAAGREALAKNLAANDLERLEAVSILDLGEVGSRGRPFELVVMKISRSVAGLRDALFRIRPWLAPDARVIAAGMDKHIPESALGVFEEIIGPTARCLATGRARHFEARFDAELKVGTNPWPATWRAYGATLVNHGGGFSPGVLDSGTNFLLRTVENFIRFVEPEQRGPFRVVDLGCGNGIIGLSASADIATEFGRTELIALDDSALAIDATKKSWEATGVPPEAVLTTFHAHRLAEAIDPGSVHLVVVNPPFHVDSAISDETAWSMFVDAHRVLVDRGVLIILGNRHLAYHAKLAKIFGEVETLGANNRFVVHLARRSPRE